MLSSCNCCLPGEYQLTGFFLTSVLEGNLCGLTAQLFPGCMSFPSPNQQYQTTETSDLKNEAIWLKLWVCLYAATIHMYCHLFVLLFIKKSQFRTACKDDSGYITQVNSKNKKKWWYYLAVHCRIVIVLLSNINHTHTARSLYRPAATLILFLYLFQKTVLGKTGIKIFLQARCPSCCSTVSEIKVNYQNNT